MKFQTDTVSPAPRVGSTLANEPRVHSDVSLKPCSKYKTDLVSPPLSVRFYPNGQASGPSRSLKQCFECQIDTINLPTSAWVYPSG